MSFLLEKHKYALWASVKDSLNCEKGKWNKCAEYDEIDGQPQCASTCLAAQDYKLFGFNPQKDEVLLANCARCSLVLKPQALRFHYSHRHGIELKSPLSGPCGIASPSTEQRPFKCRLGQAASTSAASEDEDSPPQLHSYGTSVHKPNFSASSSPPNLVRSKKKPVEENLFDLFAVSGQKRMRLKGGNNSRAASAASSCSPVSVASSTSSTKASLRLRLVRGSKEWSASPVRMGSAGSSGTRRAEEGAQQPQDSTRGFPQQQNLESIVTSSTSCYSLHSGKKKERTGTSRNAASSLVKPKAKLRLRAEGGGNQPSMTSRRMVCVLLHDQRRKSCLDSSEKQLLSHSGEPTMRNHLHKAYATGNKAKSSSLPSSGRNSPIVTVKRSRSPNTGAIITVPALPSSSSFYESKLLTTSDVAEGFWKALTSEKKEVEESGLVNLPEYTEGVKEEPAEHVIRTIPSPKIFVDQNCQPMGTNDVFWSGLRRKSDYFCDILKSSFDVSDELEKSQITLASIHCFTSPAQNHDPFVHLNTSLEDSAALQQPHTQQKYQPKPLQNPLAHLGSPLNFQHHHKPLHLDIAASDPLLEGLGSGGQCSSDAKTPPMFASPEDLFQQPHQPMPSSVDQKPAQTLLQTSLTASSSGPNLPHQTQVAPPPPNVEISSLPQRSAGGKGLSGDFWLPPRGMPMAYPANAVVVQPPRFAPMPHNSSVPSSSSSNSAPLNTVRHITKRVRPPILAKAMGGSSGGSVGPGSGGGRTSHPSVSVTTWDVPPSRTSISVQQRLLSPTRSPVPNSSFMRSSTLPEGATMRFSSSGGHNVIAQGPPIEQGSRFIRTQQPLPSPTLPQPTPPPLQMQQKHRFILPHAQTSQTPNGYVTMVPSKDHAMLASPRHLLSPPPMTKGFIDDQMGAFMERSPEPQRLLRAASIVPQQQPPQALPPAHYPLSPHYVTSGPPGSNNNNNSPSNNRQQPQHPHNIDYLDATIRISSGASPGQYHPQTAMNNANSGPPTGGPVLTNDASGGVHASFHQQQQSPQHRRHALLRTPVPPVRVSHYPSPGHHPGYRHPQGSYF